MLFLQALKEAEFEVAPKNEERKRRDIGLADERIEDVIMAPVTVGEKQKREQNKALPDFHNWRISTCLYRIRAHGSQLCLR